MLKVFTGFQLDMAVDFTGLTKSQVERLRKAGLVKPKKSHGSYSYSFTDLLALRLVRQLVLYNVPIKNIAKAHSYLKDFSPDKNLSHYQLYVRQDTREILYIGEQPDKKFLVSMSRYGQMMAKGLVSILPVGKSLEDMRQDVIKLDKQIERGLKATKVVSLDALRKKYG